MFNHLQSLLQLRHPQDDEQELRILCIHSEASIMHFPVGPTPCVGFPSALQLEQRYLRRCNKPVGVSSHDVEAPSLVSGFTLDATSTGARWVGGVGSEEPFASASTNAMFLTHRRPQNTHAFFRRPSFPLCYGSSRCP